MKGNLPRNRRGYHTPALLKEAVSGLNVRPGGKYIDATIGGGGHGFEILRRGGILLGLDRDWDAIEHTSRRWKKEARRLKTKEENLVLVRGNFSNIGLIARENGFEGADGILFDLGVSSYQLERSKRGFSFLRNEPLDMRMSEDTDLTAYEIVNKASAAELYDIFTKFGEEKNSFAISNNIVRARRIKPIETSRELAEIVTGAVRTRGENHPATRVFQALRIVVNSEIDNLKKGLEGAFSVLAPGGRLVVISFHSLEDRIVKLFFAKLAKENRARLINKKPIIPTKEETRTNRRARSAKLRIIERIANGKL